MCARRSTLTLIIQRATGSGQTIHGVKKFRDTARRRAALFRLRTLQLGVRHLLTAKEGPCLKQETQLGLFPPTGAKILVRVLRALYLERYIKRGSALLHQR